MTGTFINLLSRFLSRLPLSAADFLGKTIGFLFYLTARKKRAIAYKNVKLAFPSKGNKEVLSIVKKSFINFGRSIIDALTISRIIDKVRIDFKAMSKLKEEGILVAIHSGSWELYNAWFAKYNKFAVLVKEQKNTPFDRFLNYQRERNKIKVCFSVKNLIESINKNYWLGLVVDHGAEDNALAVEFFGSFVPTPKGAVYLAKKFNKKIYPIFGYRLKNNIHRIEMAASLDCRDISQEQALRKINAVYEEFLKSNPYQYMWWYKRFKKRGNLRLLVLSDKKTGHLKQSLAMVSIFENLGCDVTCEMVELNIKSKIRRFFLEIAAFTSGSFCLGCLGCLRFLLAERDYKKLSRIFADVVISTGSSMAPVNLITARSLGAKSIVVLKPNTVIHKVDLVVAPEHDKTRGRNVVSIKGALTVPQASGEDYDKLRRHFNLGQERRISLFVGGSLESEKTFYSNAKVFIPRLKEFVIENKFGLLITTSRRTNQKVEDLIEKEFKEFAATDALVFSRRLNYDFIAGGLLEASDAVFVTSDSISMLSESLGLKKITVCVHLEDILGTHHINFFSSIENLANFLRPPYLIADLKQPPYSLYEYNKDILERAVMSIL
ncbi:MAG: ELM1/GtrOC1 family putative glycosyltransferase [Candidatus Omnitrophota bacterium]